VSGVPEPIRVAVVDDEELVRIGLTAIISTAADLTVVARQPTAPRCRRC